MEKTLNIELNLKQIDQLHNVTSQLSSFCFEIKKTCIATIFIVLTLVITFTDKKLDLSIFIISYITILCFWFLDGTAYFYQVKLRTMMNAKFDKVRKLSGESDESGGVIDDRGEKTIYKQLLSTSLNPSMILYYILIVLNSIGLLLFVCNVIE